MLTPGVQPSWQINFSWQAFAKQSTLFQQPYDKFIYCSPHLGGASLSAAHDLEYKQNLERWASPVDIQFFNYILSEDELLDIVNSMPGSKILFIVDDFGLEIF